MSRRRRPAAALAALAVAAGVVAAPAAEGRGTGGHGRARHGHRAHLRGTAGIAAVGGPLGWRRTPAPVVARPAPGGAPAPGGSATPAPAPVPAVAADPSPPPPPVAPVDPRSLQVRGSEFALTLSKATVLAGDVRVEFNLTGAQDPHDLVLAREDGTGEVLRFPQGAAGSVATRTLALTAGRWRLLCDLPGHEAAGMHATLVVGG